MDAADGPDAAQQPRRPRPTPHGRAVEAAYPTEPGSDAPAGGAGARSGALIRVDQVQPSDLVAAAGNAVVTAARLGRLLTRTSWRVARQLPGGTAVEQQVQRVGAVAARALDLPVDLRGMPRPRPGPGPAPTAEEQRAALLVQNADPGRSPLREAMQELLQRSVESNRGSSREYLFGTIISQLVPDEARILAALSDGSRHAAADVVVKKRRRPAYTVLANASTIGRAAGVTTPDNVPTYLTRLHGLGLIEFGPEVESLSTQYEILAADDTVRRARQEAGGGRAAKLLRKAIGLSPLGREFWAATDPSRPALTQG